MERKYFSHRRVADSNWETKAYKLLLATILLSIVFLVGIHSCYAQVPATEWQKAFGDQYQDGFTAVGGTSDGGSLAAGMKGNNSPMVNYHFWLSKTDVNGNLQWARTLGGTKNDIITTVLQTANGDYIAGGQTNSVDGAVAGNHGATDAWITKLEITNAPLWTKCYGGSGNDSCRKIVELPNGEIIVVGSTNSNDGDLATNQASNQQAGDDVWIFKINNAGNIIWQRRYGGTGQDDAYDMVALPNGNMVIAGKSRSADGDVSMNFGSSDMWVFCIDAAGNMLWERSMGGSNKDAAHGIVVTSDGGFMVSGYTMSANGMVTGFHGGEDVWVVKLDGVGNIEWQRTYGGSLRERGYSITRVNGYNVIAAQSNSTDHDITNNLGGTDVWVLAINNSGVLVWQKNFGGSLADEAMLNTQLHDGYGIGISTMTDGGIVVAAKTNSQEIINGLSSADGYLFKLKSIACDSTKANHDTAVCKSAFPFQLTVSGAGASYLWNTGATTPDIQVNAVGVFWRIAQNGCNLQIDTFVVGDTMLQLSFIHDTGICKGMEVRLSAESGLSSFLWSTGATTATIDVSGEGTFWRRGEDDCRVITDTFRVRFEVKQEIFLHDMRVCYNEPTELAASDDLELYSWNTGETTKHISVQEEGISWVRGEDACRIVTDTFLIKHKERIRTPDLGDDREICADANGIIGDTQANVAYLWSTGETQDHIRPKVPGTFVLTVTNTCEALADTINIQLYNCNDCLFVPNAFTPNGDGLNDAFSAIAKCPVTNFRMEIFNRWGELMFVGRDIHEKWDGKYKGVEMPLGTYFYHATWTGPEGKAGYNKGDVILIK